MSRDQMLSALLQHITSEGKRSTAMQPLIWLTSILLIGTLSSFYFNLPSWLNKTLVGLLLFIILVFIGVYIYFMLTNSDALRSEKYSLKKMAIERGLGDSITTGELIEEDQNRVISATVVDVDSQSGEQS